MFEVADKDEVLKMVRTAMSEARPVVCDEDEDEAPLEIEDWMSDPDYWK